MVKCEICGRRDAKYVCQECGRRVCELCIDPYTFTCIDCLDKIKSKTRIPAYTSMPIGAPVNSIAKFMLIGFVVAFIGMMLIMVGAIISGAQISGSVIIFPFIPIPFIIGVGPESITATLISVIVAIVFLILIAFFIWFWLRRIG